MSAQILDGIVFSAEIKEDVKRRVAAMKEQGVIPGLAVILVGDDPASEIYVRNKGKGCEETGMLSRTVKMDASVTQEALEAEIGKELGELEEMLNGQAE